VNELSELSAWTFELPHAGTAVRRITVVQLPEDFSDEDWKKQVAADEKDIRTLFVQPAAGGFRVTAFTGKGPDSPSTEELEGVAALVVNQRLGSEYQMVDVVVGDHVERIALPSQPIDLGRDYRVHTASGLEQYVADYNDGVLRGLEAQLRSPLGVIPFVGAGMSAGFGFPQWGQFLNQIAKATTLRDEIASLIEAGDYVEAAERLEQHLHPDEFQRLIADTFEREPDPAKLDTGALSFLPFLTQGPVLTTNFDRVLEHAFRVAGRPFKEIIPGRYPDRTMAAIHRNQRALLKLHGEARDRTFRVFTNPEYEAAFDTGPVTLTSMAWLTFTNRPLLFLGCSLEQDRTVAVLQKVHDELGGLPHYAVLATHHSFPRREERERQLRTMGISPLWFAPGDFDEIERLLGDLIQRSSTRLLRAPDRRPPPPVPVSEEPEAGLQRFRDAVEAGAWLDEAKDSDLGPTLDLVGRALGDGRLAFFLGAYASLGTQPLGNEFYAMLADRFGAPLLPGDDRAATAAFVLTRRGRQALLQEVQAAFTKPGRQAVPGLVHRILAALPGLLRARQPERSAALWVLTTNYDTLMEDALADAGEPYYLLYYMGGIVAEHEGLFAVRSPDGAERILEQPDHYRWLDDGYSVVVKLNGGLLRDSRIEPSLVTAPGHFERLADRIPGALPAVLRRALRERSLLFLGHGLREADVNAIIAYAAPGDGTTKSWALQPPPERWDWRQKSEERAAYLSRLGLEVVRCDLERFMRRLHQGLLRRTF